MHDNIEFIPYKRRDYVVFTICLGFSFMACCKTKKGANTVNFLVNKACHGGSLMGYFFILDIVARLETNKRDSVCRNIVCTCRI